MLIEVCNISISLGQDGIFLTLNSGILLTALAVATVLPIIRQAASSGLVQKTLPRMRGESSMKSAKTIAINGIIAALYIALTLISPFSFGVVNIRLSDVIPAIGCIDKRYRWGVAVGMILANLFSPYGLVDVCVAVLICFCAFF